jgi:hypothetical protein
MNWKIHGGSLCEAVELALNVSDDALPLTWLYCPMVEQDVLTNEKVLKYLWFLI